MSEAVGAEVRSLLVFPRSLPLSFPMKKIGVFSGWVEGNLHKAKLQIAVVDADLALFVNQKLFLDPFSSLRINISLF